MAKGSAGRRLGNPADAVAGATASPAAALKWERPLCSFWVLSTEEAGCQDLGTDVQSPGAEGFVWCFVSVYAE